MKWNQRMSEALLTAHDNEDDVECQFCAKETHSLFGLSWGVSALAEGGGGRGKRNVGVRSANDGKYEKYIKP